MSSVSSADASDDEAVARGIRIGSFKIIQRIGLGGMGAVYLGEHQEIGARVAIKVMRPELAAQQELLTRFINEARMITKLRHPNIVEIYDYGYSPELGRYIMLEYLSGESLHHYLAARGALSPYEAVSICLHVTEALAAAHALNVIHRDLKPENIFIIPKGETSHVKLLDFGMAKITEDQGPDALQTRAGQILGTPAYMAPEQVVGARDFDPRLDIYAVGVILFELLTGRRPFIADDVTQLMTMHYNETPPSPSAFVPGIPPDLEKVVLQCLEKSRADRPATAKQLRDSLSKVLPTLSRRVPPRAGDSVSPDKPPSSKSTPGIISVEPPPFVLRSVISLLQKKLIENTPAPIPVNKPLPSPSSPTGSGSQASLTSSKLAALRAQANQPVPVAPPRNKRREQFLALGFMGSALFAVLFAGLWLFSGNTPSTPPVAPPTKPAPEPTPPKGNIVMHQVVLDSDPRGATVTKKDGSSLGETPLQFVINGEPLELTLTLAGRGKISMRLDETTPARFKVVLPPEQP